MKRVFLTLLVAGSALIFSCNPDDNKGKDKKVDKEEVSSTDEEEESGDEEESTTRKTSVEEKATAELCDCFNSALGDMNPKVKRIIVKAGNSDDPMQTLQSEMAKITDKDEQVQIAEQFQQFQDDPKMQSCSDRIKKKYDLDDNDKAAQKRIMKAAEENEECDVVYALMQIGLKQEGGSSNLTDDDQ